MPAVLITGANRGIGLEFVRQYRADGWRVIATCRDPRAATGLAELGANVEIRALDVANPKQVRELTAGLSGQPIDVLINNAGVYGPRKTVPGEVPWEAWLEVFRVNAVAPRAISERLMANVAASDLKRIIAISSSMGSIENTRTGDAAIYRSSKAALNMAMRGLAAIARERGVTVALLHPGWVKTDMGGPEAPLTPAASIAGMRTVIAGLTLEQSGGFFGHDGSPTPW